MESMRPPVVRLYDGEIIVDSFAGGGGASVGMEWATGRSPDIAINHDPQAVAMHAANHPDTKHFVEDVWTIDPVKVCAGRPVGLAWFSPDCKHFSKAKGGKPVSKKIRGLAWIVVKWAKLVNPRVICLENVEEFQTWGPLGEDNRPDKLRKGVTFQRWKAALEKIGYVVEFRELIAADYGAPTTRKRLFLVARRDGKPIRWPKKTYDQHGRYGLPKWRAAAECIDWSIACPSIFLTTEECRPLKIKRPLAENTMRRIARGLQKFVFDNPKPFIVPYYGGGKDRAHDTDEPMRTQSADPRFSLVAPVVAKFRGDSPGSSMESPLPTITAGPAVNPAGAAHAMAVVAAGIIPLTHQGSDRVEDVTEPARTITGAHRGERALATAVLVRTAHGEMDKNGKKRGKGEHDTAEPLPTQTASPDFALTTAYIARIGQTGHGDNPGRDAEAPLSTVTSKAEHLLVTPYLAGVGGRKGQSPETGVEVPYHTITAKADTVLVTPILTGAGGPEYSGKPTSVEKPMGTLVAENHKAVVAATLVTTGYGEREGQAPRVPGIEKPLGTVVAGGSKHALVAAFLAQHNGGYYDERGGAGRSAELPMSTITTQGSNQAVVQAAFGVKLKGTCKDGQQLDLPLATINAEGTHHACAKAFMVAYYGNEEDGQQVVEPMRTLTARDRLGLVMVHDEPYIITDIGMRMLVPPELYKAQGFPPTYQINVIYKGKPLPKDAQVRMCGNSVSPYPCAALVAAQFEDEQSIPVAA